MSEEKEQLQLPSAPGALYFNGFGVGIGAIDLSAILMLNQAPQIELKMTYSTAKGLAASLAEAVANYEKHTSTKVILGSDLSKAFTKSAKNPSAK